MQLEMEKERNTKVMLHGLHSDANLKLLFRSSFYRLH